MLGRWPRYAGGPPALGDGIASCRAWLGGGNVHEARATRQQPLRTPPQENTRSAQLQSMTSESNSAFPQARAAMRVTLVDGSSQIRIQQARNAHNSY